MTDRKPPSPRKAIRNDSQPEPVYFPIPENLTARGFSEDSWQQIDMSPEVVERLALVLAGINPIVLVDFQNKHGSEGRNIHQLRCDSGLKRVSPSRELANDHRCVLWPCLQTSEKSFGELWHQSRSVAGGQDSTLLIKQVHWLKRINMAASDAALSKATESIDLSELVQMSPKILFFLFRSAIRHIDRDCNQTPPVTDAPTLKSRIMQKLAGRTADQPPAIYFPASILRETEIYLETSLTVARVLKFANQHLRQHRA